MTITKKVLAGTALALVATPVAGLVVDASEQSIKFGTDSVSGFKTFLADAGFTNLSDFEVAELQGEMSVNVSGGTLSDEVLLKVNTVYTLTQANSDSSYFIVEPKQVDNETKLVAVEVKAPSTYVPATVKVQDTYSEVTQGDKVKVAVLSPEIKVWKVGGTETTVNATTVRYVPTDSEVTYNNILTESYIELDKPAVGEVVVYQDGDKLKVLGNADFVNNNATLIATVSELIQDSNNKDLEALKTAVLKKTQTDVVSSLAKALNEPAADEFSVAKMTETLTQAETLYNTIVGENHLKSKDSTATDYLNALSQVIKDFNAKNNALAEKLKVTKSAEDVPTLATNNELTEAKLSYEKAKENLVKAFETYKVSGAEVTADSLHESVDKSLLEQYTYASTVSKIVADLKSKDLTHTAKVEALKKYREWQSNVGAVTEDDALYKYVTAVYGYGEQEIKKAGYFVSEQMQVLPATKFAFIKSTENKKVDLFLGLTNLDLSSFTFNGASVGATAHEIADETTYKQGVLLTNLPNEDGILSYKDDEGITHSTFIYSGKTEYQEKLIRQTLTTAVSTGDFAYNQATHDTMKKVVALLEKGFTATPLEVQQFNMSEQFQIKHKGLYQVLYNFEQALDLNNKLVTADNDPAKVAMVLGGTPIPNTLDKSLVNEMYKSTIDLTADKTTNISRLNATLNLLADLEKFMDTMDATTYTKFLATKGTVQSFLQPNQAGTDFLNAVEGVYKAVHVTNDATGKGVLQSKAEMQKAISSLAPFIQSMTQPVAELNNTLYFAILMNDFLQFKTTQDVGLKEASDEIVKYFTNKVTPLPSNIRTTYLGVYEQHKKQIGYTDGVIIDTDTGSETKPNPGDTSGNLNPIGKNSLSLEKVANGTIFFLENGSEKAVLEISGIGTGYKDTYNLTVQVGDEEFTGTYNKTTSKWEVDLQGLDNGKHTMRVTLRDGKLPSVRQNLTTYLVASDTLLTIKNLESDLQKLKGSTKALDSKDFAVLESYYIAMLAQEYASDSEGNKKPFGLEAYNDLKTKVNALNYSKTGTKAILDDIYSSAIDFVKKTKVDTTLEKNEQPDVSVQSLATLLGISISKVDKVSDADMHQAFSMHINDVAVKDKAKVAEETLGMLQLVSNLVTNPTESGAKAALKTLDDKLARSMPLRLYLEQVVNATQLLIAKDTTTEDLKNIAESMGELDSEGIPTAVGIVAEALAHLDTLEKVEPAEGVDFAYQYEEELADLAKLLGNKYISENNTFYRTVLDRYKALLAKHNIELPKPPTEETPVDGDKDGTGEGGETPPETGVKTSVVVKADDVKNALASENKTLDIKVVDGFLYKLDLNAMNFNTHKEGVTDKDKATVKVDVTKNSNGFVVSLAVTDGTKDVAVTNTGKMNAINISSSVLDMSNNKYKIFRMENGKEVPVLGKLEADGTYTLYTQYTGEFIVQERDITPIDSGKFYNANDIQEFVERGILGVDELNRVKPNQEMNVEEVTTAISKAFGAVESSAEKIKELLGDTIENVVKANLDQAVTSVDIFTREQAAVIITTLIERFENKAMDSVENSAYEYTDFEEIEAKAVSAVEKVRGADIMVGKEDGTLFDGKKGLTKSQFTKVLRKILVRFGFLS